MRTKAKEKANRRVQILHTRRSNHSDFLVFRSTPSSGRWRICGLDVASCVFSSSNDIALLVRTPFDAMMPNFSPLFDAARCTEHKRSAHTGAARFAQTIIVITVFYETLGKARIAFC